MTANLVDDVPSRNRAGSLNVVVEAPRGSSVKLKYDPDTGRFVWSRALVLGLRFPYDFGFFPQTLAGDGEPLDALVYAEAGSFPGVIVPGRAIGALRVEQRRDGEPVKRNDRVVVVPANEHRRAGLEDIGQLPARVRDEIEAFFRASLVLTGKSVTFRGWAGRDEAGDLVTDAEARYAST